MVNWSMTESVDVTGQLIRDRECWWQWSIDPWPTVLMLLVNWSMTGSVDVVGQLIRDRECWCQWSNHWGLGYIIHVIINFVLMSVMIVFFFFFYSVPPHLLLHFLFSSFLQSFFIFSSSSFFSPKTQWCLVTIVRVCSLTTVQTPWRSHRFLSLT